MAGGGVAGGQVIGSTDAVGESPRENPVTPSDLVATIYQLLGIDPALQLTTVDGRPVSITPHGSKVIKGLIG
jgi:arylsulfatase A-like enzyme